MDKSDTNMPGFLKKDYVGLGLIAVALTLTFKGGSVWMNNHFHTEQSINLVIGSMMILLVGIDLVNFRKLSAKCPATVKPLKSKSS